jgi:two-component system, LytTR family, sensor kinase
MKPLTNSCASAVPERPRRWILVSDLNWPLMFLIYTVAGLIDTDTVFTAHLAERRGVLPYYYPLIWEMTGHYTSFALFPLIVLGFSRLPIHRRNMFWALPAHLVISFGFGATHTILMLLSRHAIYYFFGLGTYDNGQLGYRFLMEYHKQFILYWILYAILRAVAYYRQSRERERAAAALELKTSELKRQLAQAQLQALRSQLNPHFLFNTLNMVSSVMYEDVDRADHMLAALSRMLRMSLDEHVGPEVLLRRELEFVNSAIELIRARFQDQVEIDIHCPPELLELAVPSMALHTLIENAIKHHHRGEQVPIRVRVQIDRADTALHIHVLDNGPGIEDLEDAVGKGVGLANTRQRLQALYGANFTFDLSNRPEGGLHVHLAIPVHPASVPQPA